MSREPVPVPRGKLDTWRERSAPTAEVFAEVFVEVFAEVFAEALPATIVPSDQSLPSPNGRMSSACIVTYICNFERTPDCIPLGSHLGRRMPSAWSTLYRAVPSSPLSSTLASPMTSLAASACRVTRRVPSGVTSGVPSGVTSG